MSTPENDEPFILVCPIWDIETASTTEALANVATRKEECHRCKSEVCVAKSSDPAIKDGASITCINCALQLASEEEAKGEEVKVQAAWAYESKKD